MGAGRRLGVLLLIAAGLAGTAGLGAQRTPVPIGFILGQVVDGGSGRPVSGATVWVGGAPQGGVVRQATPTRILTGTDGRFLFRDLPAGNYSVNASKGGYLAGTSGRQVPDGQSRPVPITSEAPAAETTIRMWRAATIGGTITDESGEPLVRVQVMAYRQSFTGGRARFTQVGQTFTDDRGAYRIGGLRPGGYLVSASMAPRAMSLSVAREMRVHGGDGHGLGPVMQLGDFIVQLGGGSPLPPPPVDGRVQIYPPTYYPGALSASQAGVIPLSAGEDASGLDVQLRPTDVAPVRGHVFGAELNAAPLLQLNSDDIQSLGGESFGMLTPAQTDGEFLFPAVPAGDYVLNVVAMTQGGTLSRQPGAGVLWASVPITVGREPVNDVAVSLRQGLHVRGSVQFDGGRGMPDAPVLQRVPVAVEPAYGEPMSSSRGNPGMTTSRISASGTFDVAGLPGGSYVVRVTGSPPGWMFKGAYYGGRDISTEPVAMSSNLEGVVLEFTDRWTGLSGTVLNAERQPDPDATVLVFPSDRSAWEGYGPSPRRLRASPTSATGAYAFDPLPPGDYYTIALPAGAVGDWLDPMMLESLSRSATRVTVRSDGKTTRDLRTVTR